MMVQQRLQRTKSWEFATATSASSCQGLVEHQQSKFGGGCPCGSARPHCTTGRGTVRRPAAILATPPPGLINSNVAQTAAKPGGTAMGKTTVYTVGSCDKSPGPGRPSRQSGRAG